jgi:probable poly-beta-1,6-N-acetyl-D-glucosamine export protein
MVRRLLFLNGLAILSVVLYHASSWGYTSMFWWAHRYRPVGEVNFDQVGNIEYYGLRMIEQLIIFAIPAFVFVSGYFIAVAAGRENKPLGWDIVLNRIKLLAIPFLIWSVVSLLFFMLLGERYSLFDFFWRIIRGRAAGPFYFIPLLIQLYLLSPVLLFLIRKQWKLVLAVCAIIQVLILYFRYVSIFRPDLNLFSSLSEGLLFTSYIFWFVLGIVIVLHLAQFKSTLTKYRQWFLCGILVFFIAGMVEWEVLFRLSGRDWIRQEETLIDQLYALFVILFFLSFDKIKLPLHEQVTGMGTRSYAIYLTHTLVLTSTAKIIYHVAPSVMEYQILFQPVLIFMGLGIPLLLTHMVERSFLKTYYRYIFG